MLSMGAVNAFLKTLEEPPANVIFILATTDPQKLPITILSRCQRFDFKRISKSDISDRLRKIVGAQGVLADEKSLELISRVSDGAMRDALSILDQAIAMGDGSVNYDSVVGMLGLVTNEYLFNITSAIIERNIQKAMNIIEEVVYAGKDINLFIKDLTGHFRNLLMAKVTNNPEEVLDMSMENINLIKEQGSRIRVEEIMRDIRILQEAEGNAKISKQARLYLELATIKMCKIEYDTSSEVILARINRLEEAIKSGKIQVATQVQQSNNQVAEVSNVQKRTATQNVINKEQAVTEAPVIEGNVNATTSIGDIQRSWHDILEALKARRAMVIYASLMTGRPVACNNGVVVIKYEEEYAFNKIRLEKPENIKVINEVVSEVMRERLRVRFTVETKEEAERNPEEVLLQALGESALEIIDE